MIMLDKRIAYCTPWLQTNGLYSVMEDTGLKSMTLISFSTIKQNVMQHILSGSAAHGFISSLCINIKESK